MKKYRVVFEDKGWGCPLEHECACHIVLTYYGWMEECEGLLNKRPKFCPLEEVTENEEIPR